MDQTLAGLKIPAPLLTLGRGIGQVFFQENALSGACFALGIALSSPLMAIGAVVGSAIGMATARLLKYDDAEISAGIFGFNATLVGIATLFFFQLGAVSLLLLAAGCVVATVLTWLLRRYAPFPTYTAPFILTTWGVFFLGQILGASRVDPGGAIEPGGVLMGAVHGVSQVMFQANILTALLFLAGIALSNWRHAVWVALASSIGALVGSYHAAASSRVLDIESLADRSLLDSISLGLYGYNATLAAVALYLWRKTLIAPLLGIVVAILISELFPKVGLPALTAPFVLATWAVLALGRLEERLHGTSEVS